MSIDQKTQLENRFFQIIHQGIYPNRPLTKQVAVDLEKETELRHLKVSVKKLTKVKNSLDGILTGRCVLQKNQAPVDLDGVAEKVKNLVLEIQGLENQCQGLEAQITYREDLDLEALKKAKNSPKGQKILAFIHALWGTIDTCTLPQFQPQLYSRNLAVQGLLAYAWQKANSKADLIPLLKAMPDLIDPASFWIIDGSNPKKLEAWLKSHYSEEKNYKPIFKRLSPIFRKYQIKKMDQLVTVLKRPEDGVQFRARMQAQADKSPPVIKYGQAQHKSLGANPAYKENEKNYSGYKRKYGTFSNCGEAAVETLVAFFGFRSGDKRIDAKRFEELERINRFKLFKRELETD